MTTDFPNDETRLREMDDVPSPLFALDREGLFVYANKAFLDFLGIDAESLKSPEFRKRLSRLCPLPSPGTETGTSESRWIRQDGSPVEVEVRLSPERLAGPILSLGSVREISLRRAAMAKVDRLASQNDLLIRANELMAIVPDEAALLEKLLALFSETLPLPFVRILTPARKGGFVSVAGSGSTPEDPEISSLESRLPLDGSSLPAQVLASAQTISLLLADSRPSPWEELLSGRGLRHLLGVPVTKNGPVFAVLLFGSPDPESLSSGLSAALSGLSKTLSKTLDRLDLERRSQEVNSLQRALLDNSLSGVVVLKERIIQNTNRRLLQMLGYDRPEELENKSIGLLYYDPEEFVATGRDLYSRIFREKTVRYTDIRARKKDGTPLWVDTSATLVREGPLDFVVISLQEAQLRHDQTDRLGRLANYNHLLAHVNALIAEAADEESLLRSFCDICTGRANLVAAEISRPDANGWLEALAFSGDSSVRSGQSASIREDLPEGQSLKGTVWRQGTPLFAGDLPEDAEFFPLEEDLFSAGIRSMASLPVFRKGAIFGVLSLFDARLDLCDPDLFEILTEIARALSRALDRLDLESRERESAAIIRALFGKTSSGIMMARDRSIIMVNDQLVRLFGYDAREMTGRDASYLYDSQEEYLRVGALFYPRILETEGVFVPDVRARKKDGSLLWVDIYGSTLDLGDDRTVIFTITDVTVRHNQERRLARLSLFTRLLAEFRRLAASAKDENELLDGVCRLTTEKGIAEIAWIGRPDPEGWFSIGHSSGQTSWIDGLRLSVDPSRPEGRGAAGEAWRSGEIHINTLSDPGEKEIPSSWEKTVIENGIRTTASVPVTRGGAPFAILSFLDRQTDAFDEDLSQILRELGRSLSEGLDRLDRMAEQKRLVSALASVGEGVLVVSTDMTILYANAAMERLLGRTREELVGVSPYLLAGPETDPAALGRIEETFRTGTPFQNTLLFYKKDGSTFWDLLTINPIVDGSNAIREFVGIHRDVTEIVEASKRFERASLHDKLTGLPNRNALDIHLNTALARAKRTGRPLAVGFIDLDDFKPVNDTWGHESGDRLLREFAARGRALTRETDFFGRLAGDEFVVVFESLDGESPAALESALGTAIARLHQAVEAPFGIAPDRQATIGMSMGVALFPADGETPDVLLRKADLAMYRSKEEKGARNRWWTIAREEPVAPEREETFDIYGPQALSLLERFQPLFDEVTRQFAGIFYDRLAADPQARTILERLSPERRDRLVDSQTRHLRLLLSPDTRNEEILEVSSNLGAIHALVGVPVPLILSAKTLYSTIFFEKIAKAPLSVSDRLRLLLLFESRLDEDIRRQVEAYGKTVERYSDCLTTSAASSATPWPDILSREISALEELPGMTGVLFLRPDRQGGFVAEAASHIAFPWEDPQLLRALTSAWNENRPIFLHCENPSPKDRTHPEKWCSSLFLPVNDTTGRPSAILFLAGAWPNQFDSAWAGRFIKNLSRRWNELCSRSLISSRTLEEESSRQLRRNLLEGGLRIYFQPVVDFESGTATRVEALARLERPDGKVLSPGAFLPLLGESDLIWLFREGLEMAAEKLSRWDSQGLFLTLSLNLPPHVLADDRCSRWVREPLERHGIAPSRLTLELLENQYMDPRTQTEGIRRILAEGVKLSIDDLGSGYSTLERLASVPFDTIKVDQGLLFRFFSSPLETIALVGAIVELGRDFNHHVVIEGLGHPDLVDVARILGARYGQGFALARPMPSDEIPAFIDRFRIPAGEPVIKSASGALAYLWKNDSRGTRPLGEPADCPLHAYLTARAGPGSLPLLWHEGIHLDPESRPLFRENLKSWIAEKIRKESPQDL